MHARTAVGPAELVTLKLLALEGAHPGPTRVTCSGLADRLDASTQTASRRLQRLEEADLLEREITGDGQRVALTEAGRRRLHGEYADYRRIFEDEAAVTLSGAVTSGMGEGRHYISLPGYMEQFRERLGYEPFAGTLNLELGEESVRKRARMDALDPITIEGWEGEDRTYGPAYCWPATVEVGDATASDGGAPEADGRRYERAHAIAPERTHHGDDQLELIAPVKLRDEFGIDDGDVLSVHVAEH